MSVAVTQALEDAGFNYSQGVYLGGGDLPEDLASMHAQMWPTAHSDLT